MHCCTPCPLAAAVAAAAGSRALFALPSCCRHPAGAGSAATRGSSSEQHAGLMTVTPAWLLTTAAWCRCVLGI
jgi:hypothetical protein